MNTLQTTTTSQTAHRKSGKNRQIFIAGEITDAQMLDYTSETDDIYYFGERKWASIAHKRNITNVEIDPCDLPYEDKLFDSIILWHFIEQHLWQRWILQECMRVLKDNGQVIVSMPNAYKLSRFINPLFLLNKLVSNNTKPSSKIHYRPQQIDDILRRIDIDIERKTTIGFPYSAQPRGLSKNQSVKDNFNIGTDFLIIGRKKSYPEMRHDAFNSDIKSFSEAYEKEPLRQRLEGKFQNWLSQFPQYRNLVPQEINTEGLKNKKILILSPHPDDELIGAGGLALKLLALGGKVHIIELMDGRKLGSLSDAPEALQTKRTDEVIAVAKEMNLTQLTTWNTIELNDGNLKELASYLTEILHNDKPDWIFVPFINDIHPDHVATNKILLESLRSFPNNMIENVKILSYEVWGKVPVNRYINIDDVFDEKMRLLMFFKTALKVQDYIDFCREVNLFNHYNMTKKAGYAEVFFELDTPQYLSLAQQIFYSNNIPIETSKLSD